MRRIAIDVPSRSYEVLVGDGILRSAGELIPQGDEESIMVLTDRRVRAHWWDVAKKALNTRGKKLALLEVNPGESSKSFASAANLLRRMARRSIRRHDLLVALGGGVITDLGGFVASIYQRGIPLVHIPTSLVAQVDAAIGGKTAVNLPQGKNLTGTFYQPISVIADTSAVSTLPHREYVSGLAEVIKYGLTLDPSLLALIADVEPIRNRDAGFLEELVSRCVQLKGRIVSEDERDTSSRAVLNYGHTLGHALEAHGGYERWLHGEAISVGMVFAAELSRELGLVSEDVVAEHRRIFQMHGLPVSAPFDPEEIAKRWNMDKKNLRGQRWVLLSDLGEWKLVGDVGGAQIQAALSRMVAA